MKPSGNKLIILLFLILPALTLPLSTAKTVEKGKKIVAFVSILPQKQFVESVGGENVIVHVMVEPGQSPATYEPTPKQMYNLSRADIYYSIGVPFESIWMSKIRSSNRSMKIVETHKGIKLRKIDSLEEASHHNDYHHHGLYDPHVWLDPNLVMLQIDNIARGLSDIDPANSRSYKKRAEVYKEKLKQLDAEIASILKGTKNRKFMVFHPSWGYFAGRYNLQQIPIESEGKEPSAKQLNKILDICRKENLKVIFVQQQFNRTNAEMIARTIGGRVISVDPLAEDYINNLRNVAKLFSETIK